MCRNIRVLHNFAPPTTADEMRDAALQYVRKVSGLPKPNKLDEATFQQAVDEITRATETLLANLKTRTIVRTREGEIAKAREKWQRREATQRAR